MSGASVEQVLGLWSAELGGLKARIRPLFWPRWTCLFHYCGTALTPYPVVRRGALR